MDYASAVTCVMCVGQGAPVDSATRELVAAETPELLEELANHDLTYCFESAARSTAYAQPAIFCATVAMARRLLKSDIPKFIAGHSLGEYSALVVAGALDVIDGLRLVALRGRLMQRAAESAVPSGMLVVRAGVWDVEDVLCKMPQLTVANDNAVRQVVLAGEVGALDATVEMLRGRGVRAARLPVSGAFHHPLMTPVVDEMAKALKGIDFHRPTSTVISGYTARPFQDVRAELAAGITARVRWRELTQWLLKKGANRFVDLGPGRILADLATKATRDTRCVVVA